MDSVKEFYKDYNNGHEIYSLNKHIINLINQEMPKSVFEFGCGTGKNLSLIQAGERVGVDLSSNAIMDGWRKYKDISLTISDEGILKSFKDNQFDISFTISVLDHIPSPEAEGIVSELKRISSKVYIVESNDVWHSFCFPHDYEDMGLTKLDYSWISPKTGGEYNIWHTI